MTLYITTKIKRIACVFISALLIFTGAAAFLGCSESDSAKGQFLNSLTKLSEFRGGNFALAKSQVFTFLADFETQLSLNLESSDIYRLNAAAVGEEVSIGFYTYELLKLSLMVYDQTDGAFNPFLPRLSALWGFNSQAAHRIPSQGEIDAVLTYCTPDAKNALEFKGEDIVIKLAEGLQVDLGAIAKGYAVEKCRDIALSCGVSGGIINIAGNIYTIGGHSSGRDFTIGITDPRAAQTKTSLFGEVSLSDMSISVSGDYQRFFIGSDGIRYSHIFDAKQGRPVHNGVTSVAILSTNGALADAYATAAMVMGAQKGLDFLNDNDIKGIILTADYQYYIAGGIAVNNISSAYISALSAVTEE